MKKSFVLSFLCLMILYGFISCENASFSQNNENEKEATGKISGKVTYSNLEESNYGGIIVTLDKTDGLRTIAVNKAVVSRRVENTARSLLGTVTTSKDGSYAFENIEPGTYTVYAASSYSKEKAVCTNVVVRSAEETIAEVLKLTATGSISGRITLDNKTSGNSGFLVFVAGTSYMAMTDDAGNYTISDVPAGSGYQVLATKNSVIHILSSNVTVTANGASAMPNDTFTSDELKNIDGKDGSDGVSIVWLGVFDSESEIKEPKYLNAYFNKTDGCSYIYDGTEWTLLARSGANGSKDDGSTTAIAIGTILSTESITNQNVIITINVNKANLTKIGYVYSSKSIDWINAKSVLNYSDFVTIMPDADGSYKIVAPSNGYYTIAVKDSDGYVSYTEEYISNIDKIGPDKVSELKAKYDWNEKTITVTWANPSDNDLGYIVLSYTKGGNQIVSNSRISDTSYLLSDVDAKGDEYVFTVYAIDKLGNMGSSSTVNITARAIPEAKSTDLIKFNNIKNAKYLVTQWAPLTKERSVPTRAGELYAEDSLLAVVEKTDEDGEVVKYANGDPVLVEKK